LQQLKQHFNMAEAIDTDSKILPDTPECQKIENEALRDAQREFKNEKGQPIEEIFDTKSKKKKSFLGVSKKVSVEKEVIDVSESNKNWLTQFEKVEMEALEVGMQHFYMGGLAPG